MDEYVFSDRAVTGATIAGRVGLSRLIETAHQRPKPFDYVLIDDTSRLSRDQIDQQEIVRDLKFLGIYVYFVSQGIDSITEQAEDVILPVHGITDSLYRRELAKKTQRGMAGQVLRGFNPGGRTYGYKYTKVYDPSGGTDKKTGGPRILGTKIEIDEDKRPIIEDIFTKYAGRIGLKDIAKSLNDSGISPPGSNRQRRLLNTKPSWCPHAIRYILRNPKYNGDWTWNRSRWLTNRKTGKRRYETNPLDKYVESRRPELRIISDELWSKVVARFEAQKHSGKPKRGGIRNHHLFSGLLKCEICGANYVIVMKTSRNDPVYGCSINWNRGAKVCPNNARVRKSEVEGVLLKNIKGQLLNPNQLQQLAQLVNEKIAALSKCEPARLQILRKQEAQLMAEIENIARFIESRSEYSAILDRRLSEKENALQKVQREIGDASRISNTDGIRINKGQVSSCVFRLNEMLQKDVIGARAELSNMMHEISLIPISHKGQRLLRAKIKPNYVGLLSIAGNSSKELNSGGALFHSLENSEPIVIYLRIANKRTG
jgi:DNA invertase Pin-like site-specific DNA recombinase